MAKFEKEEKDFFPNNLKKIRIEKGLTVKDISLQTGLDDSLLQRFEKCERTINNEALVKICNALQCNPIQLLGEDNFEFKSVEFFTDEEVEILRLMQQLTDSDRMFLVENIRFLIWKHSVKAKELEDLLLDKEN